MNHFCTAQAETGSPAAFSPLALARFINTNRSTDNASEIAEPGPARDEEHEEICPPDDDAPQPIGEGVGKAGGEDEKGREVALTPDRDSARRGPRIYPRIFFCGDLNTVRKSE
jgi:hypothetical protein